MSVEETNRTTRIIGKIAGVDSTAVHQPYHRNRVGIDMKPLRVEILVERGGWVGDRTTVTVYGNMFRKNGSVGEMGAEATYGRRVGELDPAQMPDWLAEFVADATDGLLPDDAGGAS